MRLLRLCLLVMFSLSPVLAQESSDGPTDEKAQKTFSHAVAARPITGFSRCGLLLLVLTQTP
jgi:hypothetical protein